MIGVAFGGSGLLSGIVCGLGIGAGSYAGGGGGAARGGSGIGTGSTSGAGCWSGCRAASGRVIGVAAHDAENERSMVLAIHVCLRCRIVITS